MFTHFIQTLQSYQLSPGQWALAILSAVILGISKGGISAISILTVTLLAHVFGGRNSTGILLPMLILADVFAVAWFRRHTQWRHLLRMLPWMLAGVVLGAWLGGELNEAVFKAIMASIILISVAVLLWREYRHSEEVPQHWSFAGAMGLGAGFTTMVGNLAGGFSNVYFLSMRLPKAQFIGTGAWLFCIVNLFKLPFHVFMWKTISADSLAINAALLPFLLTGFSIGLYIVRNIPEARYRSLILWLTASSVLLVAADLAK